MNIQFAVSESVTWGVVHDYVNAVTGPHPKPNQTFIIKNWDKFCYNTVLEMSKSLVESNENIIVLNTLTITFFQLGRSLRPSRTGLYSLATDTAVGRRYMITWTPGPVQSPNPELSQCQLKVPSFNPCTWIMWTPGPVQGGEDFEPLSTPPDFVAQSTPRRIEIIVLKLWYWKWVTVWWKAIIF